MLATEKRAIAALGLLYSFRMLGLFMLLPVLALYAEEYQLSTPLLVGVALGAYGLSQALLQIPLGLLSDRYGRRRIIIAGLLLFGLGSLVAAQAETIYGVIFGRALQGSGAIASTVLALLSDLTRDEQRTKAMAAVGASIGLSFGVAMLVGPWVAEAYGVRGIFQLTAWLSLAGLVILAFLVPAGVRTRRFNGETAAAMGFIGRAIADRQLLRLNVGIFSLHFMLTAAFVVLPLMLRDDRGLAPGEHAWIYLVVLGGSFVCMLPIVIFAELRQKTRLVFLASVAMLAVSTAVMSATGAAGTLFMVLLFLFFMAFNLLEASLPSLVSKQAFPGGRGTAMGVYSTFQFLGAFLGGTLGGWVSLQGGAPAVFQMLALVGLAWLLFAWGMRVPRKLASVVLEYDGAVYSEGEVFSQLAGLQGVEDVTVVSDEAMAYLKVDDKLFDHDSLAPLQVAGSS